MLHCRQSRSSDIVKCGDSPKRLDTKNRFSVHEKVVLKSEILIGQLLQREVLTISVSPVSGWALQLARDAMRIQLLRRQLIGLLVMTAVLWTPAGSTAERPQLSDEDASAILSILVELHPEVSSSPGIKAAYYSPADTETDCFTIVLGTTAAESRDGIIGKPGSVNCRAETASVYLYPHSERRGRKDALKVMCQRVLSDERSSTAESGVWKCPVRTLRQYVQLEEQKCEVRLTGQTSTTALSAARSAGMQAIRDFGLPAPEALVVFTQYDDNHAWSIFGTDTCKSGVGVEFTRVSEADPQVAGDWKAKVRPPAKVVDETPGS